LRVKGSKNATLNYGSTVLVLGQKTNDMKLQKIQLALHKTNVAMVDNLEHLQQSLASFDKKVPKKDVRQLLGHSIVRLMDATKIFWL